MRRILGGALASVCLLGAGAAHAQWETGSTLVTVNIGYAGAKSSVSGETLHGGTINGTIEYVVPDQPVSLGFLGSFVVGDETVMVPAEGDPNTLEPVNVRIHSVPLYLTSKFWFGGSKVRGYGGFAFGFYHSMVEQSETGSDYNVDTTTSIAVGFPLGLAVFLSDEFFINGYGMLNFMDTSPYSDNWMAWGSVGIGFKV